MVCAVSPEGFKRLAMPKTAQSEPPYCSVSDKEERPARARLIEKVCLVDLIEMPTLWVPDEYEKTVIVGFCALKGIITITIIDIDDISGFARVMIRYG
jgi:hypothetical protein